ncbi:hypothetical protein ACO2Q1_16540 [Brevundimonas sp. VNH65]|uniref:hypothetical protein n=1 Tax=Brevundimonas sp. VNH65 TaxID=3400917 RepID=UPI003C08C9D8
MSTIRPDLTSLAPRPAVTPTGGQNAAQNAAQAAFFRMALGQTSPGQASPGQTTSAQPAAAARMAEPLASRAAGASPTVDPDRPLRPGSLIDIRV